MFIVICIVRIILVTIEHPLVLVSLIIMMTCIVSVYLFSMLSISWFSYTLILIILGGMIVVFIYICSLTANESIYARPKNILICIPILWTIYVSSGWTASNSLEISRTNTLEKITFNRIIAIFILLIIYLLASLIVVVKITISVIGPLRRKKN